MHYGVCVWVVHFHVSSLGKHVTFYALPQIRSLQVQGLWLGRRCKSQFVYDPTQFFMFLVFLNFYMHININWVWCRARLTGTARSHSQAGACECDEPEDGWFLLIRRPSQVLGRQFRVRTGALSCRTGGLLVVLVGFGRGFEDSRADSRNSFGCLCYISCLRMWWEKQFGVIGC